MAADFFPNKISAAFASWTDGRTAGRPNQEGRIDGRMVGRMNGHKNRRMDGTTIGR